jgi:opacity protein-like surface antigen
MKKVLLGAFLATLAIATPARAQMDDKLVHVNIGGGFTTPVGTLKDEFSTGGNFVLGVSIDPKKTVGFQVEYGYNNLAGKDRTLQGVANPGDIVNTPVLIQSHSTMHYIDFNGVARTGAKGPVNAYGIGGLGAYYRSVNLTTPSVGYATVCDPYWYVCYPAMVPVDKIVGDRTSWDMGINLGGGVTFALGESAQFYVESRWHYIWGPQFTDAAGNSQKANGQYFPVTFGFRF